jgi:hypothetical protein
MAEFKTPYSGRQRITGDKIEFQGKDLDKILSPYDGVVEVASGNEIIIKHSIDGKTIYSNFRNVGTILISRGQNVTSGSPLGRFGSNPIEFYLDDGSKKLNTGDFIGKTFGKTKTDGNSGSNRRSSGSYSDSKDSKIRSRKDYGAFKLTQGLSPFHQVWADTLALPLTMATDAMSSIFPSKGKKESFEHQKAVLEEIERIKSLLK